MRAPIGVRRNRAVSRVDDSLRRADPGDDSWAVDDAGAKAQKAASARLESLSFIDQHDGDVVFDAIPQSAPVAEKILLGFSVLELAFAIRADENL
jgi:hypothetical protein